MKARRDSPVRQRLRERFAWLRVEQAPAVIRKTVVAVIGATVLLIGIALLVLPGPAIIVIPIGLAILASEFFWARRAIRRGRIFIERTKRAITGGPTR
jgi:tellurite resistance protein TerC